MSDAMKKWMPYKSIVEQNSYLQNVLHQKYKKDKPIMSSEVKEEINYILINYKNEILNIKYYVDGYIKNIISTLYRIDVYQKKIYLNRFDSISFNNIIDIHYQ